LNYKKRERVQLKSKKTSDINNSSD